VYLQHGSPVNWILEYKILPVLSSGTAHDPL